MHSTFHGLEKWYKSEFEKFGWVAISKDSERMKEYQRSLMKLKKHLQKAYYTYEENDRKHDIAVMAKHVDALLELMERM